HRHGSCSEPPPNFPAGSPRATVPSGNRGGGRAAPRTGERGVLAGPGTLREHGGTGCPGPPLRARRVLLEKASPPHTGHRKLRSRGTGRGCGPPSPSVGSQGRPNRSSDLGAKDGRSSPTPPSHTHSHTARPYRGSACAAIRAPPAPGSACARPRAGPKTVFFWAPIMKWGLVVAGLADMARPAEKLSTAQSAVLMATGLIWSRYSLVIIPKNWSLFAVNFFVGCAGGSQLFRIWRYNQELKAQKQAQ
uniref:Mitochondrial pyruvate carrier n=2 Tax=Ficedula albicollis TaxID=59894 RepID=U3JFU3_FICAL